MVLYLKKVFLIVCYILGSIILNTILNAFLFSASSDSPIYNLSIAAQYDNNPFIHINGITLDVRKPESAIPDDFKYFNTSENNYFLLKFKSRVKDSWRVDLKKMGVVFYDYVPFNTYLIKAEYRQLKLLKARSYVSWIDYYHPFFKITPPLRMALIDDSEVEDYSRKGKIKLLVTVFRTYDAENMAQSLRMIRGTEIIRTERNKKINRVWLNVDIKMFRNVLVMLSHIKDVVTVELLTEVIPMNYAARWVHQKNVENMLPLYDNNLKGQGQIAAVTDTGYDYDSCYFWDPVLGMPPVDIQEPWGDVPENLNMRKVIMYYAMDSVLCGDLGQPGAVDWHGTHVAGSLAGHNYNVPNGPDVFDGIAFSAKLLLEDLGSGFYFLNNACGSVYELFDVAYKDGARVHSNSWGNACGKCPCSGNVYDYLARDADQFAWENKDMAIFFAAGNSAWKCPNGTVISPGIAKNVVSVGGNAHDYQADQMYWASSLGLTYDERLKPDVLAEAVNVVSANCDNDPQTYNCDLLMGSGTSMATPVAAGYGVLTREYFADGYYPTGLPDALNSFNPSSALVKAILINSSVAMLGVPEMPPNKTEGWGRLKLDDALYFPGDQRKLFVKDDNIGLASGWNRCFNISVNNSAEPLKVTLVWTDYPAFLNADPALVNDLMLELISPSGAIYHQTLGPDFVPVTTADSSNPQDNRNTEEQIALESPGTGTYTLKVSGVNVPESLQPFALVATGDIGQAPGLVPTGLNAVPSGANRITLNWNTLSGAVCYDIYRALGNCTNGEIIKIASCVPGTAFIDANVSGSSTYSYRVAAVFSNGCSSDLSNCAEATATGSCTLSPIFNGVKEIVNNSTDPCSLTLQWESALSQCPSFSSVTYSIFRGPDPYFAPSSANLLASCVTGTSYVDQDIAGGQKYYYIVRAEDSRPGGGNGFCNSGNMDENLIMKEKYATGTKTALFEEDGGDFHPVQMQMGANWSLSGYKNHTVNGMYSYSSGSVNNQCSAIVSPVINLINGVYYDFSFWTQYNIEEGWDGAVVQLSTDNGTSWQIIEPDGGYPSIIINSSNSCVIPNTRVYSGSEPVWTEGHYDLSDFSGKSIMLGFLYGANSSFNLEGWYLDDIQVASYGSCANQFGAVPREASPPSNPILCRKANANRVTCYYSSGGPCATDNAVYYGNLSNVSSYIYNGARCHIGVGGTVTFNPGQENSFWVIVSNNGTNEGSAGKDSADKERPDPAVNNGPCSFTQSFFHIC